MKFRNILIASIALIGLQANAKTFELSSGFKPGEEFKIENKKVEKEVLPVGNLYLLEKPEANFDYSYVYVSPEQHKVNGTLDLKTFKDDKSCKDFLSTKNEDVQKMYDVESTDFKGSAKRFVDKDSNNAKNIVLNCDENNTFAFITLDQDQIDKNK